MEHSSSNSKKSFLPHWDGEIYTKYASSFYDFVTTCTGWRRQLGRHALEGLSGQDVLDVGCGTGFLVSLLCKEGFEAIGVDPSKGMLEAAKENYPELQDSLFEASAEQLPFIDENFDIVLASGSLVHVPEIESAAREMARVLRPGGLLRIIDHSEPVEKTLSTPLCRLFSHASGDILHDYPHYFSPYVDLVSHRSLGRGGFLQCFDFKKKRK